VIRLRRIVSIAGSMVIIGGLVAAVAVRTAASAPVALAATTVQGTDIYGQTTVTSWPDVKSAGMSFVGIQAYNGATVPNTNYHAQVTAALGQGLFVMPYVFADPLKIAGGAQFTKAWSVIDSVTGAPYVRGGQMLPIALDMESDPAVTGDPCYGLSQPQMVSWISAFITAARAGSASAPVIYTSPGWWLKCTGNGTAFGGEPLWDAAYNVTSPQIPPGWAGYTFWQSSDTGTVGGISGAADLDQLQTTPTVTAAVGAGGSTQLRTLNSLAGQPVSYGSASTLPTGVTLTSAGLLSWSSAAKAGEYQVAVTPVSTATPAQAVVPSSIVVTLKVHGTIVLGTSSRSATVGAPIGLSIDYAGTDVKAGFKPTFKVAGLPPGLTESTNGQITGWPSRPGTYHVTVSATDALGATASASFTYTISAAADSGPAGQIRQVGGSGKCLNDPGGNTADGTRLNLWTCTGKSNQRWTTVQDGTLRTGGKCLGTVGDSSASGAKLQLVACNSADGAQHWLAGTDGQLVNPQSGKCLDVPVASAANNAQPVIEPCANSTSQPNEHWLRPAAAIASGLNWTCMEAAGADADLHSCANVTDQHWQPQPDGTVRADGKCLADTLTNVGSTLSVARCSGAALTKWKLLSAGPIATEMVSAVSGLCVSAPPTNKTSQLVLARCANAPATTWRVG
jgi:GH25 family lysozyme M1 (1,4-beta-N-acetylmuramidase)